MSKAHPTNVAASVHQRLLNAARSGGRPFNDLLQYYALERFLACLSVSQHRDHFVLKGAMMFRVWRVAVTRPTMDIDLLGRLPNQAELIASVFSDICTAAVSEDGMAYAGDTVRVEPITADAEYVGLRVRMEGRLGNARVPIQVDIGFGDTVTPKPHMVEVPAMLSGETIRLQGYPRETTIAEKFHAMVQRGSLNSRIKDFHDIWALAAQFEFDGTTLAKAIHRTFSVRQTTIAANPCP